MDCLMLHRAPENDKNLEKLWAVLENEAQLAIFLRLDAETTWWPVELWH